jgi:predicted RNase H-like nuclease
MKFFGLDGCRNGWFYVGIDETDQYEFGIISAIEEIIPIAHSAQLILIDIPIGLREEDTKERLCDLEARKVLGSRKSSVFPPPSRLSLKCNIYLEASQLNFQYTGRRLSKQSFAISKKIKEVDEFIVSNKMQGKFREMHPEVCFWALNHYQPMKFNKKKFDGLKERKQILNKYFSNNNNLVDEALSKYLKKDLASNDILDALVGAVSARFHKNLRQLPDYPETDAIGLKMEIVYPAIYL